MSKLLAVVGKTLNNFWGIRLLQILLVITISVESVLLVEAILRIFSFQNYKNKYFLWPPYLSRIVKPVQGVFPGISGEKKFFINSLGMRGEEVSEYQTARVLAIGGSTTESGMLDESEVWPYLLQIKLRTAYGDKVWVGNAGRRGSTLRDHILHLKYLVPQIGKIQTVIMLVGVNDFMFHLTPQGQAEIISKKTISEAELVAHAFFIHPYVNYGYKGSAIWNLLKQTKISLFGRKLIIDIDGKTQLELAEKRLKTVKIDKLPDLEPALNYYKSQLQQIVKLAQVENVRLIFLTHPSIWKEVMPAEEDKLLWFGCVDSEGNYLCYSTAVLAEGMQRYNQILLDVCEEFKLNCLDLDKKLPKNTSAFYDDVHFNPNGSSLVAENIYHYLVTNKLLE